MPTYEYRCTKGHTFELFHSIRDDKPKRCPKCGARAKRVPAGGAGLLFKGSGFYITDYRSKSYKEKASAEKPPASGSGGGSEKPASGSSGGSEKPASGGGTSGSGSKPEGGAKKGRGGGGASGTSGS
ncbi:MAG TPA: FmdB family zinc ribbon protein [Candidatus Udaeobacter sp.]|jgi:putative FmdB family regulatory protein|nr:FmdB family zinc ribbon protein [Candidatus Udaeobacter sp.]